MFAWFHFLAFRKNKDVKNSLAAAFTATVIFAVSFYLLNRLFP